MFYAANYKGLNEALSVTINWFAVENCKIDLLRFEVCRVGCVATLAVAVLALHDVVVLRLLDHDHLSEPKSVKA